MGTGGDATTPKPTEAATSEPHSDVKEEAREQQATTRDDQCMVAESDNAKSDRDVEEEAPGGKVTHLDDDEETPNGKAMHIGGSEEETLSEKSSHMGVSEEPPGGKVTHIDSEEQAVGVADNHSQIYDLFAITVCGKHMCSRGLATCNVVL